MIAISDKGRGCTRKDIGVYYNDAHDHGPVRMAFANAVDKLLPTAPREFYLAFAEEHEEALPSPHAKIAVDTVTIFVWAPIVSRTCQDLNRDMAIFWVGDAADYKQSLEKNEIPDRYCAPTPWP